MKKNIFKSLVAVGTLIICSFFGTFRGDAKALETSAMTVSPIYQRIILIPGETYSGAISVSNFSDSTRALEYEVEVGSFNRARGEGAKDDYDAVDYTTVTNYNQIKDWIKLEKTSGSVPINSTDKIPYVINVPMDAPAGGQYASIIVVDKTGDDTSSNSNVKIENEFQFLSTIYAEVAGETRQIGSIEDNFIPGMIFNGPLTVSSMVKNEGNVHADVKYLLEVSSIFSGEEIFSNASEEVSHLVLPGTERYNTQEWANVPVVGIFKVKQTVEIFSETSIVEKVVIVCPLWLLFVIIFIIAAIIIRIIMKMRSRKR